MTEQEAIEELKERYLTMSMCGNVDECKKNNQAISMAVAALEKQIPRKLIRKSGAFTSSYKCPQCDGYVAFRNKFCEYCGQALDWSEE